MKILHFKEELVTIEFVEKRGGVSFGLDGVDQSIFIIFHINNTHVIVSLPA